MPVELITFGGTDRRLVLSNGEAIRAPSYLATWSRIRIGLLGAFDASASVAGSPRLAVGVCNGNANGYGSPNSDHVVGIRTNRSTLQRSGTTPYLIMGTTGGSADFQAFKKIAGTITSTNMTATNAEIIVSAGTGIRTGIFFEIEKGSPNFTFRIACLRQNIADLPEANFLQMMEVDALSSISAVSTGSSAAYIRWSTTDFTLAVDEATNGDLDHIFVHWDKASAPYGFNIMHRMVA